MWSRLLKKIHKNISALVIVVLLAGSFALTPLNQKGEVQEAEAIFAALGIVFDPTNLVQNTVSAVSNAATALVQGNLFSKEFVLDPIFHSLAKMILSRMTQSIVTWINGGFQGSPAFITDLKGFLLDAADEIVGEFIYNDPSLNFLCSPFQLDVKIALDIAYHKDTYAGFTEEALCTLSDVTENVEGFLSGSFSEGGWNSWFAVTQNAQNTPTGAYLAAEAEMYARIVDAQGRTIKELDWGEGFLSFKVCDGDPTGSGSESQNCDITTPGAVIAESLNKSLGAGTDSLIEADEINEVISALFSQLAQQAITGVFGLLGLGNSAYADDSYGDSGNTSYLEALESEPSTVGSIREPFTETIATQRQYITLQEEVVQMINTAQDELVAQQASADLATCTELQDITLPTTLTNARTTAISQLRIVSGVLVELMIIEDRFNGATNPDIQLRVIEDYNALMAEGNVATQEDNGTLQVQIDTLYPILIEDVASSTAVAIDACGGV